MDKKLNTVQLSGKEYPIKCSNYVLAQIQDEYGTISEFEKKLSGRIEMIDENGEPVTNEEGLRMYKKTEPSMKALNFALPLMVIEGTRIEAEKKKKDIPDMTPEEIIRKIDTNPFVLANTVLEEFYRALAIKK